MTNTILVFLVFAAVCFTGGVFLLLLGAKPSEWDREIEDERQSEYLKKAHQKKEQKGVHK